MSVQVTVSRKANIGGKQFGTDKPITADSKIQVDKTLDAAKTGTLTTRTDDNTGEITGQASHGVTTGARLDVYWSGGHRRGMTVGTVAGNAIPIDGGSGDNLPALSTALTIMVPTEEVLIFDGDNLQLLSVYGEAKCIFVFTGADDVEDYSRVFDGASGADFWWDDGLEANPVVGDDVTKVFLSHGDSSASRTLRVAVLIN